MSTPWLEVRKRCSHGHLFSHYTNTKVRPYEKCDGGSNVTLRPFDHGFDPGDSWNGEITAWVEVDGND